MTRLAVTRQEDPCGRSTPISHCPVPFSERDLARLWQDQTFPPEALVTTEGERLRVVYRGRRTGGPGPDFRDALIAAPRGLLQGDVELHVRSGDFRRHGHQEDPAYAGVILHLVLWDNDDGGRTPLPGGRLAPVVALARWVAGREQEIRRWLERPALWREPCFSSLVRLGGAEVAATLDRLGDMRFRQKVAVFARRLREGAEPDELLWRALLEALAYGGDREAFRLLAHRVSWARLHTRLAALPPAERAAEGLRLLNGAVAGLPFMQQGGRRPADSPQRRLQGAAQLAARFAEEGMLDAFRRVLEAASAKAESRNPASASGLRGSSFEFVSLPGVRFSRPEPQVGANLTKLLAVPALIGRGRAVEIAANAVLPCLAATGPEDISRRAEALYHRLPLPARYGAVRHLHEAIGGALPVNFRRQQGMLYLHKQYCTQGGCGRCPLS